MKAKIGIILILILNACNEYRSFKLAELEVKRLELHKPSSIFFSIWDTTFFIATQEGTIANADTNFNIIAKKEIANESFSCIFADEMTLFAVSKKDLISFDKGTFEIKNRIPLSILNLKQSKILGFFFNSLTKTFDFVLQGKYLENVQFNPISFKKIKSIHIGKSLKIVSAFQFSKYLYLISNLSKTIYVCDITNNFQIIKTFKFDPIEFTSGTILPPSTLVLLSSDTRRVFKYKLNQ